MNKYVNKHVVISHSGNSQTLYITGSDIHTLYTDGLINGDCTGAGAIVTVFEQQPIFVVYDGASVRRYDLSGASLGTADTFTD